MSLQTSDNRIVCHCVQVSEGQIIKAIQDGATTLDALKDELNIACTCKCCMPEVMQILSENGILSP